MEIIIKCTFSGYVSMFAFLLYLSELFWQPQLPRFYSFFSNDKYVCMYFLNVFLQCSKMY